jgi:hypothetical protein
MEPTCIEGPIFPRVIASILLLLKSDLCTFSRTPLPLSPAEESGRRGVELGRFPLALAGLRIDALELGLFVVAIVLVVAILGTGIILEASFVPDVLELRIEALELGLFVVVIVLALVVAILETGIVLVVSFALTLRLLVLSAFLMILRGGGGGGGCGFCIAGRV